MKKNNKHDGLFYLSIVGILFIPILYSGFFIGAFNDPYNNLDKVDVAIVNEDLEVDCNNSKLNVGKELEDKLKENEKFKWNFVSKKEATKGMEDNKYYFSVEIPKEFSKNICSTLNNDYKEASLIYKKNDNSNYITGLLGNSLLSELKSELNQNITTNFLKTLALNLDETTTLKEGTKKLLDGTVELKNGTVNIRNGAKKLYDNTSLLSKNTLDLVSGTNKLNSSYDAFNKGLNKVNDNTGLISDGYNTLNTSISDYKAVLEASINSSNLPDETKAALIANYNAILTNSTYLNESLKEIKGGIGALNTNSNIIKGSISKIDSSTSTVSKYLNDLKNGTYSLYNGSQSLVNGSYELNKGIDTLNKGVIKMSESMKKLNLSDNAKNISKPVTTTNENYSEVKNYGYGFSPYFISLGLFVGGITATVVIGSRNSGEKKTKKDIINRVKLYSFIAIMQALILNVILLVTQIHIDNILLFNVFTILMSLTFTALIQMFTLLFNDVGKFICIILMILQLTASGGTFPVETSPKFFQSIHNIMPMTYTVDALRAIIGNGNMSLVRNSSIVLIGISLISSLVIFVYFKKIKTK